MMTIGGARVVNRHRRSGSLEAGKSAELIVLDRDLSEVPVDQVGDTEVLLTLFEGRPVYQARLDSTTMV